MDNKVGALIYRCRLCGAEFTNGTVPHSFQALCNMIIGEDIWIKFGVQPTMLDYHSCKNPLETGVADFIGIRYETEIDS